MVTWDYADLDIQHRDPSQEREHNTKARGKHTQTRVSGNTKGRPEIGPGVLLHQDLDLRNAWQLYHTSWPS